MYLIVVDRNKYSGSDSAIARAFGAQVTMARAEHGLYLVIGRDRSPFVAVGSAGGLTLVQFPGTFAAGLAAERKGMGSAGGLTLVQFPGTFVTLALLRFEAFLALRGHPHLQHIGPVTLDHARFEQFAAAAGLDLAPDPAEQPT